MIDNSCKTCGGKLLRQGFRDKCQNCGNIWEVESSNDERVMKRLLAWDALLNSDFETAEERFEEITNEEPKNHEAFWGKALSYAGIKYVVDRNENKSVPTCNSISENSFITSPDVLNAINNAPRDIADNYKQQAEIIENIRQEWLKKARKEKPYDVFLCFKDSDREHGIERTDDSNDAYALYNDLTREGYRVFFSRVSLEDKTSEHYEPYIYNALKTAKVMIVFGEKAEYFNAVWVKNEWTRFRKMIDDGKKDANSLVVVYKNIDPGSLPVGLKSRQCLNAGDFRFFETLTHHIEKIVHPKKEKDKDKEKAKKKKWPIIAAIALVLAVCIGASYAIPNLLGWDEETQASGPVSVLSNKQYGISIDANDQLFPDGATLSVEALKSGEVYDKATNVLSEIAENMHVYDIELLAGGEAIEPGCTVTVTISVPKDIPTDKAVLYHVAENGDYTRIETVVSGDSLMFETDHFSIYVLAKDKLPKSILVFNANGGSGLMGNAEVYSSQITTLPECTYTRDGYHFVGWATEAKGDVVALDKENYQVGDKRTYNFYAVWEPNSYEVTFNPNGATCDTDKIEVYYGVDYTLPEPMWAGHTFAGWFNGTKKYVGGAWLDIENVTLTAKWDVIVYSITYELGGGYVENTSSYDTENGATIYDPTRDGYTFLGWTYEGQDEPKTNVVIPIGTIGDLTLTAHWQANTYTVTLNANGGACDQTEVTVTYGEGYELPTPEWAGHAFTGWYVDGWLIEGDVWNYSYNVDLVAGWETATYKITYELDGGYVYNVESYTAETSVTIYDPTREGYTFLGWTYEGQDEPKTGVVFPIGTTGDLTLTAHWQANTYTVTFDANGGTCDQTEMTVTYGEGYELPTPEWAGRSFTGWYVNGYLIEGDVWNYSYNVDLVAGWETTVYNITYELDGGYVYNVESYTAETGATIYDPTRDGYTFLGWTYEGQDEPKTNVVFPIGTTGDLTLTAHWQANTYTVTFDANGGEGIDTEMLVEYGSECTLPVPTRVGYSFAGWFTGYEEYKDGTWSTAYDVHLVATWTERTDITYVVNHYLQNFENDEYTIDKTETFTGTVDEYVTPEVYSYEHFISPEAQTVSILPDGSLVIDYYYDREAYYMTYVTNGGEAIEVQKYKYSQPLTISTPTREGYTFGGWFSDPELTQPYSATETLNENTSIYAYWTEENKPADFTYEVIENTWSGTKTIKLTGYVGTDTTMHVPAYIGGAPVTTIVGHAFKEQTNLKKVVIPNTVTSQGAGMFEGCASLEELTLPFMNYSAEDEDHFSMLFVYGYGNEYVPASLKKVTITSQTVIPPSAFHGCVNIVEINLPENMTKIGGYAFSGCNALVRINSEEDGVFNIPAGVEEIKIETFYKCSLVETINLGEAVTKIGSYAFGSCTSLTSIVIPASVKTIDQFAFSGCMSLIRINSEVDGEINIPEGVESIGAYAFKGLVGITKVSIPTSVTWQGKAIFAECTSIEELTLPFVNNSATDTYRFSILFEDTNNNEYVPASVKKVTITSQTAIPPSAFNGCVNIVEINIPENTESIGAYAFSKCTALIRLNSEEDGVFNIPAGVTEIKSETFYNCPLAKTINLGEAVTKIASYAFGNCMSLASFVVPASVTTIENSVFSGCTSLIRINSEVDGELIIPEGVEYVGAYAFKGLANITKANIPSSVTYLGTGLFEECTAIEELTVPFVNNSAEDGDRFSVLFIDTNNNTYVPASLKKVTITSQTAIPDYAFCNCVNIVEINIPENATSIGSYAFYGCTGLIRLNSEEDGVFNLPLDLTEIKTETFYNCPLAKAINLGDAVTKIGSSAFKDCTFITSFTVPKSVKTIESSAFSGCISLIRINSEVDGELNIPDGVESIGNYAFKGLAGITKVNIPTSVTSQGKAIFEGCTSIEELTVPFVNNSADDTDRFSVLFVDLNNNSNIPASVKKVTITSQTVIPDNAFSNCVNIVEINLPENTTSIGAYAFYGCTALTRLNSEEDGVFNLPLDLTEIKTETFYNCSLAQAVNLGEAVTKIGSSAFGNCTLLTSFTLPASVKTIENSVFSGCTSLIRINSEVDGELIIPEGVESIGKYAFKGLAGITKVNIPTSVTSQGQGIFEGCTSIKELTVPFVNNSADDTDFFSVLFKDTNNNSYVPASLKKVTITSQTVIPDNAFSNCVDIVEINIPENATIIGSYAFSGCSALLRLNSEEDGVFNLPVSVTEIKSYAFNNCLFAKAINLGDAVTKIGSSAFKDCTFITSFTVPKSVKTIGSSAFSGCISLIRINSEVDGELNIPDGVESIGNFAFKGLAGITKVNIPTNVTSQGTAMFEGCTSIEELTVPFVNNNATDTDRLSVLFKDSNNNEYVPFSVKKVTITSQTVIPERAFYDCVNIVEINIPENATSIGSYAFSGCSALLRLNSEEDGVINIPKDITKIRSYTFYNCSSVEVVNLGESIININDYAFAKCSSIKRFNSVNEGELILPEGIRVIGYYAFQGLISITKVMIPDSASQINNDAFKGCNSIEEIILPFVGQKDAVSNEKYAVFGYIFGYDSGSVYNHPNENYEIPTSIKKVTITSQTVIPEYAFRNCNFIETIILPSNVSSVGENTFYNCTANVSYSYNATTSIWNGTDISTSLLGSGAESDPYQINSAADLAYLASSVNSGESYTGDYFILNVNINLNTLSWTPIGTKAKPFAGVFDGNGKKIYNLSVTMDTAYAGLFGCVSGSVKDLGVFTGTIAPASIAATTYVGPLVAYLMGTVENCYSHAVVSTDIKNIIFAGGLIGCVDTSARVINSYACGSVSAISSSGFTYAGGLVADNKGTIQGSLAFGDVLAKGSNETYSRNGGFVAKNDGTVTECYRSETQILTQNTTVGAAYCTDGTSGSISDMIAYATSNWDVSVWAFDLKYPSYK